MIKKLLAAIAVIVASTAIGYAIINVDSDGDSVIDAAYIDEASPTFTISDSATDAPLNITERSAAPTSPAAEDIYLDDGTNTASTNPGWRRYDGSVWEDIGAAAAGGGAPTNADYWVGTANGSLSAEQVVDSAASLETAANLGAYASDLLGATSEANFKSTVNLEPGTDMAAIGTTYYVDADAAAGGDGSLSTPWDEIADINAATLNPGDMVLFERGDTFADAVLAAPSGKPGLPIVFGAYGTGDKPVLDGESDVTSILRLAGDSHLVFKDLTFYRGTDAAVYITTYGADVTDVKFLSCDFKNAGGAHGASIFDRLAEDEEFAVHDVLFYNCYFYQNYAHGLGVAGYWNTHNVTVKNCVFDDNNTSEGARQGLSAITSGIAYDDTGWTLDSGTTYYRAYSYTPLRVFQDETTYRELTEGTYSALSDGEWDLNGGSLYINIGGDPSNVSIKTFVGATHHIVFEGNEVKNTSDSSSNADGVGIFLDWCVKDSLVKNNYIHGNDGYGIVTLAGVDNRIEGNLLVSNGADRATSTEILANKASLRTQISGNVISTSETYGIALQNTTDYTTIKNNVIFGATNGIADVNDPATSTNEALDGNIINCATNVLRVTAGANDIDLTAFLTSVLWSDLGGTRPDLDPDLLSGDTSDDDKVDQDIIEGFGGSATPKAVLDDTDGADAYWDCNANDADDAVATMGVDDSTGDDTSYLEMDGVNERVEIKKNLVVEKLAVLTPQAKTYDNHDDDDETIGVDLTSSVILVTGDNDSDNDSIDLQDGTLAGQSLKFICVALVDSDDTFTVDVETDSTCTGCPDSGIFAMDAVGDQLTLYWSGSAWFYGGRVEGR